MTMNFKRRSRGSGFGLVEAIIVAGVIALAAAGVYRFYSTVQAKEQSHQESQNALHVTNSTLRAYAAMASFDGISNARLVNEGLLPSGIDVSGDAANPTIGSVFGGVLTVSPVTLDGKTGGGMILNYASVPRRNCAQFVANAAAGHNFRDITVNGQNVLGPNRVLDQARVIKQCASEGESTVSFTVQHSVQASGSILSPGACVVPASSPETQTVPCPTGYHGSVTQTRTATCPSGASLPVWGPWSTTSNTCVQTCVPDPSSPQTRTSTPCPTGQYGTITESRVSACATGQTTGAPTWSAWTVVSNTCDTQCVVPADETRSPGCPSGQSGVFTERRSASCPSPTGAPVWGPWVTLTNTCAQNCVLPNPNPETRWVQQSGNCPQGYSGTKYWEAEQARTASCPSNTGTPTYTSWENTGHTRNENMAQCTALCHPEEQLERWVPKEEGCGPDFAGSKHWEARETRTSYCPTGATYPSTSDWVPTGETRNLVNTCAPSNPPPPCVLAVTTPYSWTVGGETCGGRDPESMVAAGTYEHGWLKHLSYFRDAPLNTRNGEATVTCNAGTMVVTPISCTREKK